MGSDFRHSRRVGPAPRGVIQELKLNTAIEGWTELSGWFGREPSFHDAELLLLELVGGKAPSRLVITTSRGDGKKCRVTFLLSGITEMHLTGWNFQNVFWDIRVVNGNEGVAVVMDGNIGIAGQIVAKTVSVVTDER